MKFSVVTKTGDEGMTDGNTGRVMKDGPFCELVGTLDELNAILGWAKAATFSKNIGSLILEIQSDLLSLGASLYTGDKLITEEKIEYLERQIELLEDNPGGFIIPEGTSSSALHFARAICRRAERAAWAATAPGSNVFDETLRYLNRLSDLLYVMALEQGPENPLLWSNT